MEDRFDDPRITAFGLLTEVHNGLALRLGQRLAGTGISQPEFDVLVRLARSPRRRLRMTDLAAQTTLSTSGVTRLVDRLERAGLVERVACPTDRRSWYAALTDAGADRLAALVADNAVTIDQWFTGLLTADQLSTLLDTLRIVRDVVHPGATAGAELSAELVE